MRVRDKLKILLSQTPDSPGVYIMKDAQGAALYVGKAKSLKKRLTQYLHKDVDVRVQALLSKTSVIEYQLSSDESAALLLEYGLIHSLKPRYNIALQDDKSYPLVKITQEEYPRLCFTRGRKNDGATYFGPYTNAKLLRQALQTIRRFFPYRQCHELSNEVGIYAELGLSPKLSEPKSKQEYRKTIKNISLVLGGKTEKVTKKLMHTMKDEVRKMHYENAQRIQKQITALSMFQLKGEGEIVVGEEKSQKKEVGGN